MVKYFCTSRLFFTKYAHMPHFADRMKSKLIAAFQPEMLELIDQSHLHAGHSGASPLGETHFLLRMTSSAFRGLGRLERQRRVYSVLATELAEHVHALSLHLYSPQEEENQ